MMRFPQGGLSAGNGGLKVVNCPRRGSAPRKWTSQGATAPVGDGSPPHCRYGGPLPPSVWT